MTHTSVAAFRDGYHANKYFDISDRLLVTIKETKRVTSLGHTTVFALIKAKKLETVKIGRRTLVTWASIVALAQPMPSPDGSGGQNAA
jgi:hypothetical protein